MSFYDNTNHKCNKCNSDNCSCKKGRRGPRGIEGKTGATGATGDPGPEGRRGPRGPMGYPGNAGVTGATGPPGYISEYAYIFKLDEQIVVHEEDIIFTNNGPITSGITHVAGSSEITFNTAGIYEIDYTVFSRNPNQWALFLNDTTLILSSIYGNDSGNSETVGILIVAISKDDILTVRNHTSTPGQVKVETKAGGTQNSVSASIVIKKLADLP